MIDVNVSLSRWPFRRLPDDETHRLVQRLKQAGVTHAFAGSFDALLHKDVEGVNRRLVDECNTHGDGLLLPFGCVNPTLPDWQEDVRRCREVHHMRGIRLHPNYHGYTLDAPEFNELLTLAAQHQLIVQLSIMMEDERTQHPLVQVPAVDTTPLPDVLTNHPDLPLILLNSQRAIHGEALTQLAASGNTYFDIAMQESIGGLTKLTTLVPHTRILFGSHAPFFYHESATLKLQESNLGETIRQAMAVNNAKDVLKSTTS
ncbi:MAG: amidohydrolase family protein [Planctomycetaceae bacterium]|nr:amidohydrolase family protein [Planctomycetaceae bacterium]